MLTKSLRLSGEVLILAAMVLGLWLVYVNGFTNATAQAASTQEKALLVKEWKSNPELPAQPHKSFALLYVPKLQPDSWGLPIIEGIDQVDLAKGVGHYPKSDLPGQVGNFAIAGHRVTHGQPFFNFPKLAVGDSVYIKTGQAWYEYQLFETRFVSPADYQVVTRAPGVEATDKSATSSLITLTTCDPVWNSYRRWIWWGSLVGTYPLSSPPIEVVAE